MTRRLRSYLFGAARHRCAGPAGRLRRTSFFRRARAMAARGRIAVHELGRRQGRSRQGPHQPDRRSGHLRDADFPLKVSSLGDSVPMSFSDEPRPPGAIPGGAGQSAALADRAAGADRAAVTRDDLPAPDAAPDERARPAPRRVVAPANGSRLLSDQPLAVEPSRAGPSPEAYDFRKPYAAAASAGRRGCATRARRRLAL